MRYCEPNCETMEVEIVPYVLHGKNWSTKTVRRAVAYDSSNPANRIAAIMAEAALLEGWPKVKRVTLAVQGRTIQAEPTLQREQAPAMETRAATDGRAVRVVKKQ